MAGCYLSWRNFGTLGEVKALQDTTVTKTKPLISLEDLTVEEQQVLIHDVFSMVILINFIVLLSIILHT